MIRTQYNIDKQKAENIIKCSQEDKVQRVGVLTMEQEKKIILRAGQVTRNVMQKEAKIVDKEIAEMKREREVLDIIDEKKRLDKQIKINNKKLQELSEENKEIYKKIMEKTNTKKETQETTKQPEKTTKTE